MFVLLKQFSVIAYPNCTNLEKVSLNELRGRLLQLDQNVRVRLNVADELLLLLQDVLEVLHVILWILLLFKFFDEFELAQLDESLQILEEHLLAHENLYRFREDTDGLDC